MLDESVGNGLCAVPYEMDEPYTAQFAAEQMSTGHLHEMVRVPPDTSKTGHPNRAARCRYARRDSNPQPSEPESDALSIEPLARLFIAELL